MVKVRVLHLDGYDGWDAGHYDDIELDGFNKESICQWMSNKYNDDLDGVISFWDDAATVLDKVVSLNGEEGGTIFVLLD